MRHVPCSDTRTQEKRNGRNSVGDDGGKVFGWKDEDDKAHGGGDVSVRAMMGGAGGFIRFLSQFFFGGVVKVYGGKQVPRPMIHDKVRAIDFVGCYTGGLVEARQ